MAVENVLIKTSLYENQHYDKEFRQKIVFLIHFQPKPHLRKNQVVGLYYQNV